MTIYKDIRYSDSISTLTAGDNISAGDPIIVSNSGLAIPANVKQQLPTTQTNLPWDINDYSAVISVHPDGERVVVADDSVIYLKSKAQGGISDISMTDSTHTFNISEIQFASSTTFICFGSRNVTNDNTWAGYGVIAVTIDNNNVMTAGNWCVVDDYAAELGEYTELSQFKTMAVNGNKILVGFKARHPTSGETGLGLKTFLLSGATITYDTCAITTPWQIVIGPAHDIKKHVADDKFLMLALDGNLMTKLFVIDTTNGIVLSASQFVGSEYSGGGQNEVLRIILNQYDGYKFSVIHHAKPNSNSVFSENRIVSSQYTMTDNTIELTHNGDMILFQSIDAHVPNSFIEASGAATQVILTEDGKMVYGSGNGGTSRKSIAHDGSTGKLFIFDLTTGAVEIITEADQIDTTFVTSDKFLNDKTLICYDTYTEFKAYLSPAHQSITSNMANGEMIGFAVNNASASEIVSINSTGSMLDGLSNLSLGQQYYLDTNGSLTTTETEIAVGKAITTSSMIVDINKTTVSSSGSSGSSGNTADITATGTLPNGAPVILKADGTIEAVGGTQTVYSESIPAGSETVFNSGTSDYISAAFDPNTAGQFVVCYKDEGNSNYGTAIVGTVSGTSINFGSEVVFNSGNTLETSVSFDPNNSGKFVVCYDDGNSNNKGTAIVGTVSGTSISFGSEAVFNNSGYAFYTSVSFDPNNSGKFVVCYMDYGNSYYGTAIVGTVSGTSISFGSEVVFNSGNTYYTSVSFDPNNSGKFVVCYAAANNSSYGTARVGTVSGTSISFGSEVVFQTSGAEFGERCLAFDPNTAGQFVVCCADTNDGYYGKIYVGTISGTSITFGSQILFNGSNNATNMSVAFDPNDSGKLVVCYKDGGNSSYGTAIVGTVSGTSISFNSEFIFNAAASDNNFVTFDPNNAGKFVVCYQDDSNYGTAIVGQLAAQAVTTNLTSDNFIGVSTGAYADGETATVTLQGGVSSNQTGLTAGATYYVQADGTLATTPSDPSVEVGKAVTPTTLLLKGL